MTPHPPFSKKGLQKTYIPVLTLHILPLIQDLLILHLKNHESFLFFNLLSKSFLSKTAVKPLASDIRNLRRARTTIPNNRRKAYARHFGSLAIRIVVLAYQLHHQSHLILMYRRPAFPEAGFCFCNLFSSLCTFLDHAAFQFGHGKQRSNEVNIPG